MYAPLRQCTGWKAGLEEYPLPGVRKNVLAGWHKESQIAYSQIASQKQEVIWMNFKPVKHSQMSLFEMDGGINDE